MFHFVLRDLIRVRGCSKPAHPECQAHPGSRKPGRGLKEDAAVGATLCTTWCPVKACRDGRRWRLPRGVTQRLQEAQQPVYHLGCFSRPGNLGWLTSVLSWILFSSLLLLSPYMVCQTYDFTGLRIFKVIWRRGELTLSQPALEKIPIFLSCLPSLFYLADTLLFPDIHEAGYIFPERRCREKLVCEWVGQVPSGSGCSVGALRLSQLLYSSCLSLD